MQFDSARAQIAERLAPAAPGRSRGSIVFEGVEAPFIVLKASAPGPVVWVEAAVHGDENDGTAAVLRLADELDGALLRGAVVLLPAANADAYRAGLLGSPRDGRNLNRMGVVEEDLFSVRWFRLLADLAAAFATVFVDLHGGGRWLDVAPFAMVPQGAATSLELARGLELDYVLENPSRANLIGVLARRGLTALLLEAGCGSALREESIERHCRNVKRILAAAGLLSEDARPALTSRPLVLGSMVDLCFPEDGAMRRFAPVGTVLAKGDAVVQYDTWPELRPQTLVSPVEGGVLLSVHSSSLIRKGAYAALIGSAREKS